MTGFEFEGLEYKRLFLADTMFDGHGQILVTPMDELIRKARGEAAGKTEPEGEKEGSKPPEVYVCHISQFFDYAFLKLSQTSEMDGKL
jgi:hypothetical protein